MLNLGTKRRILKFESIFSIKCPLKIMKNAFCFTLKALFAIKIFKFLSSLFDQEEKQLVLKDKVFFKVYDVKIWLTNNCNKHIDLNLEK